MLSKNEIIRMATEAGFQPPVLKELWTQGYCCVVEATQIERFAALVAANEREACAKMCEGIGGSIYVSGRSQGADFCAAAIRARGE